MQRVSIHTEDNKICIDGAWHDVDCRALVQKGIRAVQWHGSVGEVEYVGHQFQNDVFDDFTPFDGYVKKATPIRTHYDQSGDESEAIAQRERDPMTALGHNRPHEPEE